MAWTHSAKHQEAVWGYSWAARFAASTCRAIASFCGMRLTVVYDGFDGDKLDDKSIVMVVDKGQSKGGGLSPQPEPRLCQAVG